MSAEFDAAPETMEASNIFLQELFIDGDCPPTVNLQQKLFKALRKVSNVSQLKCGMNCVKSSDLAKHF